MFCATLRSSNSSASVVGGTRNRVFNKQSPCPESKCSTKPFRVENCKRQLRQEFDSNAYLDVGRLVPWTLNACTARAVPVGNIWPQWQAHVRPRDRALIFVSAIVMDRAASPSQISRISFLACFGQFRHMSNHFAQSSFNVLSHALSHLISLSTAASHDLLSFNAPTSKQRSPRGAARMMRTHSRIRENRTCAYGARSLYT